MAEQVVNLQFVVEEKERAIVVVKQALEHQRKLSANFSQKFQKELNQRLASQKSEYEAAIHRHQNFIDQVIFHIMSHAIAVENEQPANEQNMAQMIHHLKAQV